MVPRSSSQTARTAAALLLASLCACAPAGADISQATILSPGGFVQAGAYQPPGVGTFVPGVDILIPFGSGRDFDEHDFSGNSSAAADASYFAAPIDIAAHGIARLGALDLTANNTRPSGLTALGIVNAGWKDTLTISHPSLTGQSGFLLFQVRIRGTIDTSGFNGAASLHTAAYKNESELLANVHADRSQSDSPLPIRQRCVWALASDHNTLHRDVDATITMSVPITFGQAFTLGVYAGALANQRRIGGSNTSFGGVDFSDGGVTWNGIAGVLDSTGSLVSGATIGSGSGIDWSGPFARCTADLSGSSDPNDADYGVPDGSLDSADFFYFLDQFVAGNIAIADLTGSSDPNDPSYGTPDGALDAADFFYFLDAFVQGC